MLMLSPRVATDFSSPIVLASRPHHPFSNGWHLPAGAFAHNVPWPFGCPGLGCSHTPEEMSPAMSYKIATLLYAFNARDEVLLLERAQEPNLGLWSPCGGKLRTDDGESPYDCACREAREEMGVDLAVSDLRLTGLVSEHGYLGESHWLMFLFEVKPRLASLPPAHREGRFEFFPRTALAGLKLPQTDREKIWPMFWQHRGGFFAAHCHRHPDGTHEWRIQESRRARSGGGIA
jgi:8-oxo-dGTP diphosphatase